MEDRLDKIERTVVALEVDIKSMAKSISDMAEAVHELVELQVEQKLLKQDTEHKFETINQRVHVLEQDHYELVELVKDNGKMIRAMEKAIQSNTLTTIIAGKIAWAVTSAAITGVIALGFFFLR